MSNSLAIIQVKSKDAFDLNFKSESYTNKAHSDVETELIKFGRNAILATQVIGYLPLTVITEQNLSRRLTIRYLKIPYLWTIFIVIAQIFSCYSFLSSMSANVFRKLKVTLITEHFH